MDDTLPPAPFHELLGLELVEWRDGFARLVLDVGTKHLNRSGIVHGGVYMALMDQAGAYTGLFCTVPGNVRRAVTVDMDCRFAGQAERGRIIAEGTRMTAGRSLFFVRTEVRDETGRLLAYGGSTHRWRRGSNDPQGVPADAPVERG